MEIIIIEQNDTFEIVDKTITVTVHSRGYTFLLSEVDSIKLLLHNIAEDVDDMSVSVRIGEKVLIVNSSYPRFDDLLYVQLCSAFDLDEQALLRALASTDKDECVVIYERKS